MTTTDAGPADPPMSALEMCRNLVRHVDAYAREADKDKVAAHVHQLGPRQHASAQMAAYLAVVSIAEDLHRIAGALQGPAAAQTCPGGC